MAVLKDLIVHGPSRFLNGAKFNTINAESIGAEQGIFNKLIATTLDAKEATIDNLTAQNATVVGLLDVQGELHTNAWTNANIANIGGSFYISPTVEPTDGTTTISITRNSATSWTVSASGTFATDFIKSGTATSGVAWPANSLVLITGDIVLGDMVYPLGTLKGTLSSQVTATAATTSKTITITGVTDAQNNNSPSVLQELYELNNNANISGATYKNGKISLYKLGSNPIGILLSSMGTSSNSIIDIYGGVSANPSVRIGHLAGLPNVNGSAPTGWGIYTDNGYFSGVIVSTSGKIGGFTIGSTDIHNGKTSYNNSNAGIYVGTDYVAGGAGNNWWIKSDGQFQFGGTNGITYNGTTLSVPAANVSGALTAATISADKLTAGTINSSILTANNIVTDTITMGTAGSNAYIYVSKNNKSSSINSETKNWRLILGNYFAVSEAGYLTASSGKIGGWNISATALCSATTYTPDSGRILLAPAGVTTSSAIGNLPAATYTITAGSDFGVTTAGKLYATGATISGSIEATSFVAKSYSGSTLQRTMTLTTDGITLTNNVTGKTLASIGSIITLGDSTVSTSYNTFIDSSGIIMRKGTTELAKFDGSTIRIGTTSESSIRINSSGMGVYRGNDVYGYITPVTADDANYRGISMWKFGGGSITARGNGVGLNGDTYISGNTTITKNLTITGVPGISDYIPGNISCDGDINVKGNFTRNGYSYIVTEEHSVDNKSIAASSITNVDVTMTKTNYTLLGTVSIGMANASSSGTGVGKCSIRNFDMSGNTVTVAVYNNSTSAAKVKVIVRGLYRADAAI